MNAGSSRNWVKFLSWQDAVWERVEKGLVCSELDLGMQSNDVLSEGGRIVGCWKGLVIYEKSDALQSVTPFMTRWKA